MVQFIWNNIIKNFISFNLKILQGGRTTNEI